VLRPAAAEIDADRARRLSSFDDAVRVLRRLDTELRRAAVGFELMWNSFMR
jgi:hypothetical protein